MCHYLGGGLHGRQKRVKAQSESSKSVVNSVLISREMPVFPGFLEIIRVVILIILQSVKSQASRPDFFISIHGIGVELEEKLDAGFEQRMIFERGVGGKELFGGGLRLVQER